MILQMREMPWGQPRTLIKGTLDKQDQNLKNQVNKQPSPPREQRINQMSKDEYPEENKKKKKVKNGITLWHYPNRILKYSTILATSPP